MASYPSPIDSLLLSFLDNHSANTMPSHGPAQSGPVAGAEDDLEVQDSSHIDPAILAPAHTSYDAHAAYTIPPPAGGSPADATVSARLPLDATDANQGVASAPPPKKPRAARAAPKNPKAPPEYLDVAAISLHGEANGSVPVHDTCDTVRRKLRAALRRTNVTQAALLRALSSTYANGRRVLPRGLNDFLSKKGALAGNKNYAYYAAYVFFEKVRIREGAPKSEDRLAVERQWPRGVDTTADLTHAWFILGAGERGVAIDKHGAPRAYR